MILLSYGKILSSEPADDSYCGYNATTMQNILLDLVEMDYEIEEGQLFFHQNTTLLGANPSSIYGLYDLPIGEQFFISWYLTIIFFIQKK